MPLSFRELQAQLLPEWGREHDGNGVDFDLLMLPSLSVDRAQLELITGAHNYEERQLFSLVRLRDPGVRIIYVTSKLLPELVVDAVLELLPGVPTSHARRRLHLFDTDDASSRPLTEKLLERPALLARIRELLRPGRSFIGCYVVTELEKRLSEVLQVPLLGTDPTLSWWGSKAGSRALFARCGVPHPPGSALVHNLDDLAEATAQLWEAHPQLERCVVKLNEGISGEGNAPLQLAGLSDAERRPLLRQALERIPMPHPQWRELVSRQGALERDAVDFIARRFGDRWDLQAIEVNLRHGGTTHPTMALRAITAGHLDGDSGLFLSPTGQPLHDLASDNIVGPHRRSAPGRAAAGRSGGHRR